jgi:hypothetical protein
LSSEFRPHEFDLEFNWGVADFDLVFGWSDHLRPSFLSRILTWQENQNKKDVCERTSLTK